MCVCILNHVSSDFLFFNYLFVEVTLATTLHKLHVYNNIFLLCTLQLTTKNSVSICHHIVDPLYLFHSPPITPSSLVTTMFSISIYLVLFIQVFYFFIFHMSEITWYLSFFIWLISFSLIPLRYIHVERWYWAVSSLYWAIFYNFCD